MAEMHVQFPRKLPAVTALKKEWYQQRPKSGVGPNRGDTNNADNADEQVIDTYPNRNDPPSAEPHDIGLPRRVGGGRVLLLGLAAALTAFLLSPTSPVRALRGYDVLAAAVLPFAGIAAVVWATRRTR